jgi:hypothetical protein
MTEQTEFRIFSLHVAVSPEKAPVLLAVLLVIQTSVGLSVHPSLRLYTQETSSL